MYFFQFLTATEFFKIKWRQMGGVLFLPRQTGSALCVSLRCSSHFHRGFEEGVAVFVPFANLVLPFGVFPRWARHAGNVVLFHAMAAHLLREEAEEETGMNTDKHTLFFSHITSENAINTAGALNCGCTQEWESHCTCAVTCFFNQGFEDDKIEAWLVRKVCVCICLFVCLVPGSV